MLHLLDYHLKLIKVDQSSSRYCHDCTLKSPQSLRSPARCRMRRKCWKHTHFAMLTRSRGIPTRFKLWLTMSGNIIEKFSIAEWNSKDCDCDIFFFLDFYSFYCCFDETDFVQTIWVIAIAINMQLMLVKEFHWMSKTRFLCLFVYFKVRLFPSCLILCACVRELGKLQRIFRKIRLSGSK